MTLESFESSLVTILRPAFLQLGVIHVSSDVSVVRKYAR
jgi:hypothetical protein